MVAVIGAYKHGRYERICLKSLCKIKILPGKTANQNNTTDYIDPNIIHMEKKEQILKEFIFITIPFMAWCFGVTMF